MKYTNRPRQVPIQLYDQALALYLRRVRNRAMAIYQVGSFSQPGLSDIDLLVVPGCSRIDNGLYFAVRHALPEALRLPFRSDPVIVPPQRLDAIRYTTYPERKLLVGDDVAAGIVCDASPEQLWSMLFERLCQFEYLRREMEMEQSVDLVKLVSKAKSIGYSLSDVDRLTGSRLAPDFSSAVDAIRGAIFDMPDEEVGPRVEALFYQGLQAIRSEVARQLGLGEGESVEEFGRAFLLGNALIPGLSEPFLAERRQTVEEVQHLTRSYGFKKGDLFVRRPYRAQARAHYQEVSPNKPVRKALELGYHLRGMLLNTVAR